MKIEDVLKGLAQAERDERVAELVAEGPDLQPELAIATADEAQELAHDLFPDRGEATHWLVEEVTRLLVRTTGDPDATFSARSARRWLQTGECPQARVPLLITLVEAEANRRIRDANIEAEIAHAAAVDAARQAADGPMAKARLGGMGASGVSVGSCHVDYEDADEGIRHIDAVDFDYNSDEWGQFEDALEADDLEAAEAHFSTGVVNAYDRDRGGGGDLGSVLHINSYGRIDFR